MLPLEKRSMQRQMSTHNDVFSNFSWYRHWMHILVWSAVGMVVLVALLVYVIVKRRRKADTSLSFDTPKIPCPSYTIEPTRPQPLLPPAPTRIKTRGLLERRGSSASLTIDLNPLDSTLVYGTPPKECSAEEYLISAGNRMTRRQLRTCLKAAKVLHQEFLEIPLNHPNKPDIPGCGNKNRYKSIWPNEWSRVKLISAPNNQSITNTGAPKTFSFNLAQTTSITTNWSSATDPAAGYINANYIRGYDGAPRSFIATQGPLVNTVNDFWATIWQERCPCIVMMTKLKEKNKLQQTKTKCEPYLPTRDGQYGPIHVSVKLTMPKNGFFIRDLVLTKDNETHYMKHFWFIGWPDHKAPPATAEQLLELVHNVETYRALHRIKYPTKSGAVAVHCSAGIGRTGCFIATCIGCQQLREEDMVDVLGITCQMRLDRGGLIQTPEQYEFVHHALSVYERQLPDSPHTSSPLVKPAVIDSNTIPVQPSENTTPTR